MIKPEEILGKQENKENHSSRKKKTFYVGIGNFAKAQKQWKFIPQV